MDLYFAYYVSSVGKESTCNAGDTVFLDFPCGSAGK